MGCGSKIAIDFISLSLLIELASLILKAKYVLYLKWFFFHLSYSGELVDDARMRGVMRGLVAALLTGSSPVR